MKKHVDNIPIYRQFISFLSEGLNVLDEDAVHSIRKFVTSEQHVSGGFQDRAQAPDMYYSLFGYWLSSALNLNSQLEKLKDFISSEKEKEHQIVEQFAMMLMETGLFSKKHKTSLVIKLFFKHKYAGNFAYQLFLLLLLVDASGRKMWLVRWGASLFLRFYKSEENAPCSMVAALLVAKQELGLKTNIETQKLLSYFDDKNGFKTFLHTGEADMLSTSVALFALRKSGFDMRLVAPVLL